MDIRLWPGKISIVEKLKENLWLIFFFTVFFVLRLYHLGSHDFWYDEIATVGYARFPWSNWNAPLYWIILHFWVGIFGVSEFSLRFPSLLFSFFSIILTFFLGKELFSKRVGIIAASIMGLSPFHLWYAQEARDYSLLLFFAALSTLFLLKALNGSRSRIWLCFIAASIAGLYTNYFYIFLLFSQILVFLLLRKGKTCRREVFSFLVVILSFVLFLPRFLDKFQFVRGGFWLPVPKVSSLLITLENFLLGYNGTALFYLIADTLTLIFFLAAGFHFFKDRKLRESFKISFFLCFTPIFIAFIFSRFYFSVYLDRGLIISTPFFYLILSLGISSLNKYARLILVILLAGLLLTVDLRFFQDKIVKSVEHRTGAYKKIQVRPVIDFVERNADSSDIVAFTNSSIMSSFNYYGKHRTRPFYLFYDPGFPNPDWQRPMRENKFFVPYGKIANLKFDGLWIIFFNWARESCVGEESEQIKEWLDENLRFEFSKEFDGVYVAKYANAPKQK
jgi:uncharacterized membrane protein